MNEKNTFEDTIRLMCQWSRRYKSTYLQHNKGTWRVQTSAEDNSQCCDELQQHLLYMFRYIWSHFISTLAMFCHSLQPIKLEFKMHGIVWICSKILWVLPLTHNTPCHHIS